MIVSLMAGIFIVTEADENALSKFKIKDEKEAYRNKLEFWK